MTSNSQIFAGMAMFLGAVALWVALLGAYVLHIVWAIGIFIAPVQQVVGFYILAVAGIAFPPLGIIHGFILLVS